MRWDVWQINVDSIDLYKLMSRYANMLCNFGKLAFSMNTGDLSMDGRVFTPIQKDCAYNSVIVGDGILLRLMGRRSLAGVVSFRRG